MLVHYCKVLPINKKIIIMSTAIKKKEIYPIFRNKMCKTKQQTSKKLQNVDRNKSVKLTEVENSGLVEREKSF